MMAEETGDLETFAPVPRRVTAGGREIDILPLRLRQLPEFARAVEPVAPALMAGDLRGAILQHQDSLVRAVAVATGAEPDWLEDLWPDEFVALVRAVLEVNVDFFGRRVMPSITAAGTSLAEMIAAFRGASSSPGSPSADTGSPTASD